MNSKNPLRVYQYLHKRPKNSATWKEMIKDMKLGQGSLSKALDVLERKDIIRRKKEQGEKGERLRYFLIKKDIEGLFPMDDDILQASRILSSKIYYIKYQTIEKKRVPVIQNRGFKDMTERDMINLRNEIGKAKFSTRKFKRFKLKKDVKELNGLPLKDIREFMRSLGYGFTHEGANFKISRIDELAMQK